MTADEIREKSNSITVWKRGGERAPHKPLLALYAIGRVLRGEPRMVPYAQVDRDLGKLLMEFGPRPAIVSSRVSILAPAKRCQDAESR